MVSIAYPQHKNSKPAQFQDIFGDLPIHDAATLSVLNKNENPQFKIRDNIFVKSFVSKTNCYVGEPILLTYQLYSALQNESEIYRLPNFAGAAMLELSVVNEHPVYRKINNKTYRIFNLRQFQLIPQQSGEFIFDSLSVANTVRYKINPDSTGHYEGLVFSKPINLHVKQLPDLNKPVSFSGAVGNFQLKVYVDSQRIAAGETNELHIDITGQGNFIPLSIPEINWPADLDDFPMHEKSTLEKNIFPPYGSLSFNIPFVPKKQGSFILPSLHIDFFNAATGLYDKSTSKPIDLMVLPPKISAQIEKPGNDTTTFHANYRVWIWVVLALTFILGLIIFMKRKRKV